MIFFSILEDIGHNYKSWAVVILLVNRWNCDCLLHFPPVLSYKCYSERNRIQQRWIIIIILIPQKQGKLWIQTICTLLKHGITSCSLLLGWVNTFTKYSPSLNVWKSNLTDKMKRSFFQAVVVSILLYGCTTWTLTKRMEKKLDGNYTRMLRAILDKSWRQHPIKHQLYGYLPPITKTIQARRTRHAGHCWRSSDDLISDVLLWTPTYDRAEAGRPARTYIQQLCEDTGCSPEDLPEPMNDREKWLERVRDIRAGGTAWWWWWWWLNV